MKKEKQKNVESAFEKLQKVALFPPLIDAIDLSDGKTDEKSLLLFLVLMIRTLMRKAETEELKERFAALTDGEDCTTALMQQQVSSLQNRLVEVHRLCHILRNKVDQQEALNSTNQLDSLDICIADSRVNGHLVSLSQLLSSTDEIPLISSVVSALIHSFSERCGSLQQTLNDQQLLLDDILQKKEESHHREVTTLSSEISRLKEENAMLKARLNSSPPTIVNPNPNTLSPLSILRVPSLENDSIPKDVVSAPASHLNLKSRLSTSRSATNLSSLLSKFPFYDRAEDPSRKNSTAKDKLVLAGGSGSGGGSGGGRESESGSTDLFSSMVSADSIPSSLTSSSTTGIEMDTRLLSDSPPSSPASQPVPSAILFTLDEKNDGIMSSSSQESSVPEEGTSLPSTISESRRRAAPVRQRSETMERQRSIIQHCKTTSVIAPED